MTRVTRLLLKLYPRRFRRRYRDEILELSGELRTHGEISRGRLLRDLARGALSARRPPRRSQVVMVAGVAAIAAAVLFATGTVSLGRTSSRPDRSLQAQVLRRVRHLTVPGVRSGTCFVGATVCVVAACTQFVAGRTTSTGGGGADLPLTVTAVPRQVRRLSAGPRRRRVRRLSAAPRPRPTEKTHCVSDPRPQRAHPVFVGG